MPGEPASCCGRKSNVLSEADGEEEDEEGCLSLPDIRIDVLRNKTMKITAFDLEGKPFEQVETGFITRIWQHEFDHLNGVMLTDRMGPMAKMANRRKLKDLEEKMNRLLKELETLKDDKSPK